MSDKDVLLAVRLAFKLIYGENGNFDDNESPLLKSTINLLSRSKSDSIQNLSRQSMSRSVMLGH